MATASTYLDEVSQIRWTKRAAGNISVTQQKGLELRNPETTGHGLGHSPVVGKPERRPDSVSAMRILVAIANHGAGNRRFLDMLVDEFRSMSFRVDVVVLSNVPNDLGDDVEVVVGVPTRNPWSLPFAHRNLFADRVDDYDLFIYTEDDTLITERNIAAFLKATEVLPEDEIAGFMRTERDSGGSTYVSTVHSHFRWDPSCVRTVGEYTFAFFTNPHSACFVLTRHQLKRVIASGGFLVTPHEGRYDMLVSAATDPYTQCGLRKMVCISHLDDFLLPHLPNRYVGTMGLRKEDFLRQIEVLRSIERSDLPREQLFRTETEFPEGRWSKQYYEPPQTGLLDLFPKRSRTALSIGCGWGATEDLLVSQGIRVVGIPLDSVIAANAEDQGVEIVHADLEQARQSLTHERFDCLLLANVLHLVEDPVQLLSVFSELLSTEGVVLASVPNFRQISVLRIRLRRTRRFGKIGSHEETGVHFVDRSVVKEWFSRAGLKVETFLPVIPERIRRLTRSTLGLGKDCFAAEFLVVGKIANVS